MKMRTNFQKFSVNSGTIGIKFGGIGAIFMGLQPIHQLSNTLLDLFQGFDSHNGRKHCQTLCTRQCLIAPAPALCLAFDALPVGKIFVRIASPVRIVSLL